MAAKNPSSLRRNPSIPLVLAAALAALFLPGCPKKIKPTGAGVHGSVYTLLGKDQHFAATVGGAPVQIYVPDFEVFLKEVSSGTKTPPVKTNLFGRFLFRTQNPGTYQLCWDQPGWVPGCFPENVDIGSNTKFPGPVEVAPLVSAAVGPVWGRVLQADDTSPWTYEEYYGLERTAKVTAFGTGGAKLAEARANIVGHFILVNVPRGAGVDVNAELEGAKATVALAAPAIGSGAPANLKFKNHPPLLVGLTATLGGKPVREVTAGAVVDVSAEDRDADGDSLTYAWKAGPASGGVVPLGPGKARWTLPASPGRDTLYLVVSDGNGGYAKRNITLTTGAADTAFGGKVIDQTTGAPVGGATISVNSVPATASAAGLFSVRVPLKDKYIVNVSATGYALSSRLYDHGGVSRVYPLVPAQVTTVDPTRPIDVVDRRPELRKKERKGARLQVEAGTLVDAGGAAASGPLQLSFSTLDIANAEMPGDFGAMTGGTEVNLISYGAAFIEFKDGSGKKFNLAPGKTAKMLLPAPPSILASAPPNIVLWSYDEKTGFWDDSAGKAKFDAASGNYVATLKHLSTLNTDIDKNTAACLRVDLDSSVPVNKLKVRITYKAGPIAFAQTPELLLDSQKNAFYRLPGNDDVTILPLDANLNPPVPITDVLVFDNGTAAPGGVINVGPPSTPLWPPDPFGNCKLIVLKMQIPAWGGFSSSPFLGFPGPGTEDQTVGYYQTVNPGATFNAATKVWSGGNRSTLGAWWSIAGFAADGSGGTRTSYLNDNDLGFGRDMHVIQNGSDVFAYVTNYGGANQNPANADLAAAANVTDRLATVCMEYSLLAAQPGEGRIVKFFVYAKGDATSPLINSANLDGFGEKFVPNLCNNCHGGQFYSPANPAAPTFTEVSMRPGPGPGRGSSFREFDLATFKYPMLSNTPAPAVLPDFYQQNQMIKATSPQPGITDLINGWYAGSTTVQDNTWVPPNPNGWAGAPQQALYQDVVRESCRTCHVAFGSDQNHGLNWTSYAQFKQKRSAISSIVCGPYKEMPHALVTYRNFWLSTGPHRPDSLKTFSDTGWTAFGACQ